MQGNSAVAGQGGYPSAVSGWYLVFVLYIAYTLSFVDRTIIAFLVGPIRADLHITDFQFSLLNGLAFVIFYAVLGIPIGRMVDSYNRRQLVVIGVAFWSVMTALCGVASTFWQLFVTRLGVGVGEATLSPSAVSMLSDSFPPEKRGLAISMFAAGIHAGAGMANIFGGIVVMFSMGGALTVLPLLGELRPWQLAFILVALPGILVVGLLYTVREPLRRERSRGSSGASFAGTLSYMRQHWLVYTTLIIGAAFSAMSMYGAFQWVPAMYQRSFGWNPGQIGWYIGLLTIIGGTGSMFFSGWLAGVLLKKGVTGVYPKIMMSAMLLAIGPALLLVMRNDPYWSLIWLGCLVVLLSAPIGLVQAALQAISPNETRGMIIAVYLFFVAVIGTGGGPSAVAAMTDFYYHNDAMVGHSIAWLVGVTAAISALLQFIAIGAYKRKAAVTDFSGT
ncbi:MAG: MFS transporter [Gammaproteobacteria bacterium]|nr:MFS transporter [Gammaproteobacteria bacterium]